MTDALFRDDAYLRQCQATVIRHEPEGLVLDRTVFYPVGGGQPGDRGWLSWAGGRIEVLDTRRTAQGEILHLTDTDQPRPDEGSTVQAELDWELRYRHMRMHTCMHLLGVVLPHGVTGGNITAQRSRLDFDMEDAVDKEQVTEQLNALIQANHPVTSQWISGDELQRQPELIRTLSVAPPRTAELIRLLGIGDIDLQPCGGTHVAATGEIIGALVVKTEKKGRHNRRVHIELLDEA